MKKLFIITLLLLNACLFFGQQTRISGTVFGVTASSDAKETLPFANIYVLQDGSGAVSDKDGRFTLTLHGKLPQQIKVSYVGYITDTVTITKSTKELNIELFSELLDAVEIVSRKRATEISTFSTQNLTTITTHGLQLLACCNLSESFENDPTVDVGFSDAVSGAKQIKMLGLDGKYSLLLVEAMPAIRGLASMYGLTYIPGTWMRCIEISKGASSAESGYESISGQINVGLLAPKTTDPLFVNIYGNGEGRMEGNVVTGGRVAKNAFSNLMVSGAWQDMPHDGNDDGFADVPVNKNINLMNTWTVDVKGGHINMVFNYLHDERRGGQMGFLNNLKDGTQYYGFENKADRAYGVVKYGIFVGEEHCRSVAAQVEGIYHNQTSFYGYNGYQNYDATQYSFMGALKYLWMSSDGKHKTSTGIGYTRDQYNEKYITANGAPSPEGLAELGRTQSIPGAFAEYTFTPSEKSTLVAGVRYDSDSYFGDFFSPRLHFKYAVLKNLTWRVSGGKGYHTPLLFTDFSRYLPSSRKWIIADDLKAEEAWNFGSSFTWTFDVNHNREGSITGDVFYTTFENQFVADPFASTHEVHFYNVSRSTALSAQVSVNAEVIKNFDITIAGRYNDVKTDFKDNKGKEVPYNNKYKGLITLNYATNHRKWEFTLTTQLNGKVPVPEINNATNPDYSRNGESEFYTIMHTQITKNWRRLSVYLGAENLLDYTQPNPIIAADNPFSPDFDASGVWGPLAGRMFYAGLRYSIR
ncbi:MAG: TonB-dependent receptor [Bacteroidales bacterium]|nr:TonB-dependent receptor [Bacteroidales bacterium]